MSIRQQLFAFNRWTEATSANSDLGIGNSPTGSPDWTFRSNANTYTVKRVYVFINSGGGFSCQNPTVALDASGNASITVTDIDDNNSDNCGITSMSLDATSFDCSNVGANTVVLTASDAAGNTATCSATVTIEDNTLPVAVCKNITIDLDASGNATITAADVDGGSTDACGIDTRTVNTSSFSCSDVGAKTVTLTVTDNNGNSSTCDATVTVEDNVDPEITCPNNISAYATSASGAVVTYTAPVGTDNCAGAVTIQTTGQASGTTFPIGTTTNTFQVTDASGNTATCSFDVMINGLTPDITCPNNMTVNNDQGQCGAIVTYAATETMAIPPSVITYNINPGSFFSVGTTTVTATATNPVGSDQCSFTVTVVDNEVAVAMCQNITIQLSSAGTASITTADVDNGSTDNCGIASLAVSSSSFGCANVGNNTVTLTVTDIHNNVNTCTSVVTVEDNIAPIALCQDLTVQLDASGSGSVTPQQVDNGSNDACGIAGLGVSPPFFSCANVGVNTVTLTVTDNNGNSNTCTSIVTVEDNVNPTALCQNLTVQLDASGNASITAAQVNNGSYDNCGIQSLAVSPSTFSCANVGGNTATLTVTDVNGNVNTCTATIALQDNVPPIALCQDITIELNATGNKSILPTDVDNGSSDNCAIASLGLDVFTFDCDDVGTNTVVLTVTDVNTNSSTCSATVTVEDHSQPVAVCQNITVFLNSSGNVSITAADVDGGSADACGIANSAVSPNNFTCSDVGPNTVTLSITDNNGNVSTCNATVTVQDNIIPTTICQNLTVQLDANGNASITAAQVNNGSFDNCDIASLSVNPSAFNCSNVGNNTTTLTVTDEHGNSSICTATITLQDNVMPTALCKNITVQLDNTGNVMITPADVDNGSSDNCAIASLTIDDNSFGCADVGTNTVTLTVTDVNNNNSTCTSTVTVQDNIAPIAACLNPTISLDANGNASISTTDVFDEVNSSDACGAPYPVFVTPSNFTCANVGANTVILQIIDLNGNTALCNATVTVVDDTPPTVVCKNTTVTLNSQGQATLQPIEVYDSGSDNCGNVNLESVTPNSFDCSNTGNTTVTLTVNDGHGNAATCTATVTIVDNVLPTALCQNITVGLDGNGQASISAADVDGGSSDNCAIASMSLSETDFDCDDIGTTTVTLTISDYAGNSATCTADVTIEDNLPPLAICQNLTIDLNPDGNYTLDASQIDNGSSDNCTDISLSVDPSQFDCSDVGSNTVTLTVTDDHNNSSTCTATLTINTFLGISNVIITHESCLGYGDGQIEIIAAATGGAQLRYSIDGGATFQLMNHFTDLSPGTYDIVVELSGNGTCSTTATAVVNPGSPQVTWYKDLDGDGYTDGITQVSCSPPAGYVASAIPGDCNDNDPSVNPGAPELCNGLDDNCDGIIQADELDADADGYRVCDGDCDDSNPAINPGATEICNNIDDDCDGLIDEGVAYGTEVHVGNVIFTSQQAIDDFSNCYYKIQGNLTIIGTDVDSLANLSYLEYVTGNVIIQATSLENLNGLDALDTIGGSLTIKLNNYADSLSSLSGLQNLDTIFHNLNISFNFALSDCCSIDDLLANAGVGGTTVIFNNAAGCNSVNDISATCGNNIVVIPGNGIAFGEQIEEARMSLYPNPASNTVTILLEGLGEQPGRLTISDQLGRVVMIQKLHEGQGVLELDLIEKGMNAGVYQVTVTTETQRLVKRLMVNR